VATSYDYADELGFVHGLLGGFVQLDRLTWYGEPDGMATIRISDIVRICRNDRHHQAALMLYEHRNDLYDDAQPQRPSAG